MATLRSPRRVEPQARQLGLTAPAPAAGPPGARVRGRHRPGRRAAASPASRPRSRRRCVDARAGLPGARSSSSRRSWPLAFGGVAGVSPGCRSSATASSPRWPSASTRARWCCRPSAGPSWTASGAALATSSPAESLFAQPRAVGDPVRRGRAPGAAARAARARAARRADQRTPFVWLRRRLPPAVAAAGRGRCASRGSASCRSRCGSIPTASWPRTSSASRASTAGSRASSGR